MKHASSRLGLLALATCLATVASAADLSFKTGRLDDDLRMELRRQTLLFGLIEDDTSDGQRLLAAARSDYARLVSALYDLGYYAPQISITLDGREAADIAPVDPPATVDKVRVTIDPGPHFKFRRAEIGPLAENTVLPENFAVGEAAHASRIRDAASAAVDGWRAVGHAKARIADQSLTANHANAAFDAIIRVDPGPELRFGDLVITGESKVRSERVREIAGLPTGKVFSPAQLEAAEDRLRRTGTFRVARLTEAEALDAQGRLPIEAQLVDTKPRRFGFGAEVATDDGLTLSGFWLHRNLLGGAERLRVDAELAQLGMTGEEDARLTVRFDRPATFRPRLDAYVVGSYVYEQEPDYDLESIGLEGGLSFRADKRRTFTLGLGAEGVRSNDAFGKREYVLFTLPFTAEYDGRNDRLNPTRGWYGRAEATPFAATGDVDSGARVFFDLRGYRSLTAEGGVVVAARAQLGSVIGPALDRSPTDMLFYSGGTSTVRGHSYKSLGIDLASGDTVGGKSFAGLSAELRVKATDKLSVVGFYDVGYISEDELPGRNGRGHSGAGIGLRYDTGIGPIRFDVATPVTGDTGDGIQLYIGIGQAF